ncbi:MAG: amidohydrolase [Lachnospiraceae bacterium]|nr:amidohydrolase [Lachnospiraceae bacterium]
MKGMEQATKAEQLMAMVDKQQNLIYEAEETIWKNPESGFREWKTSAYLEKQFENLGYELMRAGNIPGFYTDLDTGRPGPKIAILGEMDSLIVKNHPDADLDTGAVHACGHHVQCAALLGMAAAWKEPGALEGMSGSIRLMAVPAEELIELGFREELRRQGVIQYFGGKVEFIYRGYFDGVDMAMMIHANRLAEGKTFWIRRGSNGCITKNITFQGVSAHAGGSPQNGKNALYAATCGIQAANALRETFVDEEHIRFHPIITQAGLAVNAIPETAKLESYVRGASYDSMCQYNEKINLALAGAAASLGCGLEIHDRPGYFPLNNDPGLAEVVKEAMRLVAGPDSVGQDDGWGTGSTDMGDVSAIMPAVHPYVGGAVGNLHGSDFCIGDRKMACVQPAKCLVVAAELLLREEGKRAKEVIANKKPLFSSKEEYLLALDRVTMKKQAVQYQEDGTVILDYKNLEQKH